MVKKKLLIFIFAILLFILFFKTNANAACSDATKYPPIPITATTVNQGKFDFTIHMIGNPGAVNNWDAFTKTKYQTVDQQGGFFIVVSDASGNVLLPTNAISNAGLLIQPNYFEETHQSFTTTFEAVTTAAAGTYYIHLVAEQDYLNVVNSGKADFSKGVLGCSFEQSPAQSVIITSIAPKDQYLTLGEGCHADAQGVPSNPPRILCDPTGDLVCRNADDNTCNKCIEGCTCQHPLAICTTANVFGLPSPSPQPCKPVEAGSSIEYNCNTAVGNILTSPKDFVQTMMGLILSVVGGIAILLIMFSGYRLMVSQGNPESIKNAKEQLTAAIIGLLFIIFSLVILQIIGVNILGLPGFN